MTWFELYIYILFFFVFCFQELILLNFIYIINKQFRQLEVYYFRSCLIFGTRYFVHRTNIQTSYYKGMNTTSSDRNNFKNRSHTGQHSTFSYFSNIQDFEIIQDLKSIKILLTRYFLISLRRRLYLISSNYEKIQIKLDQS